MYSQPVNIYGEWNLNRDLKFKMKKEEKENTNKQTQVMNWKNKTWIRL